MTDQHSPYIRDVVFSRVSIEQVGADDVRLSSVHGPQAVDASHVGAERPNAVSIPFQMIGQHVQTDVLPADNDRTCRLPVLSRNVGGRACRSACRLVRVWMYTPVFPFGPLLVGFQIRRVHAHLSAYPVGRKLSFLIKS